MMWAKVAAVFNLIVIVFWLYQWGSFANILMSAQAAPSDPVPCLPMATAGDEALYFCEGNFGPDCVWDPSPTFAAGVLTCEW